MTPVFDAHTRLVAWFDGQYVFDLSVDWVAFHDRGDVFSSAGAWLGPLREGSFLDRAGRPVAWLAGARPASGMQPAAPMDAMRPLAPKRPLHPRTPLPPARPLQPGSGWSELTWLQWIGKAPQGESPAVDVAALRFEPVDEAACDAFFRYLDDHLADNGRDGQYFQPMSRAESSLTPDRRQGFRGGLAVPVGEPGWRRVWVARGAREAIVGHVDLRSHPERFAEHRCLLGMGVDRAHRKIGLGSRLLAHAEHWAAVTAGLKWIDLRVLSSNEAAIALYRRSAFQMSGGTPDMFVIDGTSFGDVAMAKKLGPSR